jgi:hypothetical protein
MPADMPTVAIIVGVDMGMKIHAISVALNGKDDARQGGQIGGDLLEHFLERLPGGFTEQAEYNGGGNNAEALCAGRIAIRNILAKRP